MTEAGRGAAPSGALPFRLEIDGLESAEFTECHGLTSEQDVLEYREGDVSGGVRKLTGLRSFSKILLERGVTRSGELWDWYRPVLSGEIERRSVAIVLLDERREEALRWQLEEAWPCRCSRPVLDARGGSMAIEHLELCFERISRGE